MSHNTLYGAAVVLIKNKQIYLSRRTEKVLFPKKWQFINGRLRHLEQSMDTAVRIVKEQTGVEIDKERLYYATNITIEKSNEFYYIYIVNLKENENPVNTCERFRGDWRPFPLEKAVTLDVVDGIRGVIKGLHRSLIKLDTDSIVKTIIGPPNLPKKIPQQQQRSYHTQEHIRQQLSQGEQEHLSKLGAKMTRLGQYPDGDSFGA